MKNASYKKLGKTIVALTAVLLFGSTVARATGGNADLWEAGLWWVTDPIEGLWNVKVTICGNPTPFDAMALFARGGTFHDTNSNNPTVFPTVRSAGFGTWKRLHGRTYQFAFKLFRFDAAGAPAGSQIVRHTVALARDGQSYTSEGTAEFFDVNGNKAPFPPTGCSSSTATRFK